MKRKILVKLGGNNYQAEHWRETAEKTFDFACHARYWFANGDRQAKREILAGLGSNLELYDRSVHINLEKPLQFIELALDKEPTIAEMFEPKERIDNTIRMESLWTQNLSLLPLKDLFCNSKLEFDYSLDSLKLLFSELNIATIPVASI